jgi:hypothetical protein
VENAVHISGHDVVEIGDVVGATVFFDRKAIRPVFSVDIDRPPRPELAEERGRISKVGVQVLRWKAATSGRGNKPYLQV